MKIRNIGLCKGRHEIPNVEEYVFDHELNPLDVEGITKQAETFIKENNIEQMNLYVTGLTVALVSVINVCNKNNVDLTLYHFDRDSMEYYPQEVFKK